MNSSVDTKLRGRMNGLIMTAGSLGNGSGPIVGSILYAAFTQLTVMGKHLPGLDGRLIFGIGAIMTAILSVVVRYGLAKS